MSRRGVLGLLAGGVTALLSGCGLVNNNSYRFKMTVEVETPQGVKTGSGVMKVTAYKIATLTSEEKPGGGGLTGEAVIVDLTSGPLFILLKMPRSGKNLGAAVTLALAPDTADSDIDGYVAAVRKLGGWSGNAKAELPRADWPMMVRFRDIGDPKSVEKVDPEVIGVTRIVVETTSDSVSTGIEERVPWLTQAENFHYSGQAYGEIYPLPADIFRSSTK